MNYIETFTSIYEKGSWGDDKHPVYKGSSGSGSEIDYNTDYIRCIRQFIKEKNIKTVVDLGCGTGKYYNIIYADLDIKYTGYDAYEKVILHNQSVFNPSKYTFIHKDFINNKESIESADLYIIKDVLQHCKLKDIYTFLDYITGQKKFKYIIITNCCHTASDNTDIKVGECRALSASFFPLKKYKPVKLLNYHTKEISFFTTIKPNLILVCLDNFQPYILDNIRHLLQLKTENIHVITNQTFLDEFREFGDKINIIISDTLNDTYNFYQKTPLDKNFRGGFWTLTSLRFFYIYEAMTRLNLDHVFHIENDVLLYYNIAELMPLVDNTCLYVPFDTYQRNIASIMYIPHSDLLKTILDVYDFSKNDMMNFSEIRQKIGMIKNFPIFPHTYAVTDEEKFVSENFSQFHFIFDAAAIGQYLGGVDPKNDPNNTVGFVNETCIIKYDKYKVSFENTEGIDKPFLQVNEKKYPIFNLHLHCKNLKKFIRYQALFDIVICVGPHDQKIIEESLVYNKKNIIGYRNIYLICSNPVLQLPGAITLDEKIFPFHKADIENAFGVSNRNGWYLQQLLKLYAGIVIPGLLENYLVIDADTFFFKPTKFIEDGRYLFTTGTEYHTPYFEHMTRLHNTLKKAHPLSGISHHMIFNSKRIAETMTLISDTKDTPFWELFIKAVDKDQYTRSGASEYELYFTYMYLYHRDKIVIRQLNWGHLTKLEKTNYDYASIHWYMRK